AAQYEIQIFKNEERIVSKKVTPTTYTLKATELKAEYSWKVRSINGGGDGPWSQEYTFKIMPPAPDQVTLNEPADDAVDIELTTVFKWDAVEGAEQYEIEFQNQESFTKHSITTEETEATSDKLAINTEYTWRVRAIAQEVEGEWSDKRTFTTKDIVLAAAVLSEPLADAKNVPLDFEFKWEAVEGADKYSLILTKISDASQTVIRTAGHLIVLEDYEDHGEEYSWQIIPFAGTKEGPASEVRLFHTILETSSSFFPADGATEIDRNFTIMWNPVNNAENYHLIIAEKDSKTVVVDKEDIPQIDASYIEFKVEDLAPEMSYTWKVRAINSDGESEWTDEMTFTTSTNISVLEIPHIATNISAAPNPMSNATTISFNMIEAGNIVIDIYDINGNVIDNVFSGFADKGSNSYIWNAEGLSNSVYYYSIKINDNTVVGKL
ncbi:MAG: fibronectin type III domain-containing protein, partial [Chlorobi bacterium]|nr:fibronectin type III domain-containing protein [Chlorobiota bacterium]